MNSIKTKHNLDFLVAEHKIHGLMFKIGTCHGQWGHTEDSYYILSIVNNSPGNGHLEDVFQWFENSCKREGVNLLILSCFNEEFYKHLINKKGFVAVDDENVIKIFNKKLYKKFLKNGNEVIEIK